MRLIVINHNVMAQSRFFIQLISGRKKASREYDVIMEEGQEAHWEVVERILFIYAKLNPGTGYVQGMNELIGPLYFTLASDPNKEWKGEYREMLSRSFVSLAVHSQCRQDSCQTVRTLYCIAYPYPLYFITFLGCFLLISDGQSLTTKPSGKDLKLFHRVLCL